MMENMDYLNGDIFYIIEVNINDEFLYIYTKHTALHFPDMGKKFVHKRSAVRYFKNSWFEQLNCPYHILKYSRKYRQIIPE